MNFAVISPFEVMHKYKYAKNKENMIGVLADLTVSTKEEVREFLGVKKKERKKPVKMDRIEVRRLYDQGLGDGDIAKSWAFREHLLLIGDKTTRCHETEKKSGNVGVLQTTAWSCTKWV